jgi:hypothetical protein
VFVGSRSLQELEGAAASHLPLHLTVAVSAISQARDPWSEVFLSTEFTFSISSSSFHNAHCQPCLRTFFVLVLGNNPCFFNTLPLHKQHSFFCNASPPHSQ